MESQKPKIAMYVKRSFGEKLNASFDFIRENWKLMLKFTTYLLLPLCLIQALSLNGMMKGVMSAADMDISSDTALLISFLSYYGLFVLICIIGMVLQASLIYAMIRTYNEREERLQGVTLRMLTPMLFHNIKRLFIIAFFGLLLTVCVSFVLGALSIASLPVAYLFALVIVLLALPLALWAPIYLFEDISIMDALKKTFRLGFATWGGVFLISLVMGIIAGILQGVTLVPWYAATIVKMLFTMSDVGSEATVSVGYSFMLYLLAIVQAFGTYLAMIFTFVGLAYQYGHASEKMDSVTIESDIDNFDKL